jgi:hypothetical protein
VSKAFAVSGLLHAAVLACLLWANPTTHPERSAAPGIILAIQPTPGEPESEPLPAPFAELATEALPVLVEPSPVAEPETVPEFEGPDPVPVVLR